MGLNDVFGRFRQVLEVVETPFDEDFESAAYANFATPAAFALDSLPKASTCLNYDLPLESSFSQVARWWIDPRRLDRDEPHEANALLNLHSPLLFKLRYPDQGTT